MRFSGFYYNFTGSCLKLILLCIMFSICITSRSILINADRNTPAHISFYETCKLCPRYNFFLRVQKVCRQKCQTYLESGMVAEVNDWNCSRYSCFVWACSTQDTRDEWVVAWTSDRGPPCSSEPCHCWHLQPAWAKTETASSPNDIHSF